MTIINGAHGATTTLTREQGDDLFYRIQELKKTSTENVKEKARNFNGIIDELELTSLLNQAYEDFATRVHQEYDKTPYADYANILIRSIKKDFFSNHGLNGEINQILLCK